MKYYKLPRIDDKLYRGDWEEGLIYAAYQGPSKEWCKMRIFPKERRSDRICVPDTYAILRGYIL